MANGRKSRGGRLVAAAAAATFLLSGPLAGQALRPHPIDLAGPYREADYQPIAKAIGTAPVVALGESIHISREMPLVRLRLLRALHGTRGVDALVLEGALLNAWTAQEHAYRSKAPLHERARTFAREALFGLWQTDEMEQLIAYALSTQSGPRPIYLTSFDLQPESARAYAGSSQPSLDAFVSALGTIDPQLDPKRARGWSDALGPVLGCHGEPGQDELGPKRAVADLESWIASRAGPLLAADRPPAHLAALRLVPQMMRSRLQHCQEVKAPGVASNVYQRVRDEMNAKLVLSLMRDMPRLVLWAHHSHLHHNSLGGSTPSMGQHLKAVLGDRLYTVGVFAGGGSAIDSLELESAGGAGIVAALAGRPLPRGAQFGVERRLSGLSHRDFFIDLRGAPPQWAQPDFSRLEVGARMPTALARDFDGAILLHEVSGAELNFLPAPFRGTVRAVGWVLRNPVLAALGALLVLLALGAGIRGLWRRWRARRARRGTAAE
jgi:erythromycin esterase-like protein